MSIILISTLWCIGDLRSGSRTEINKSRNASLSHMEEKYERKIQEILSALDGSKHTIEATASSHIETVVKLKLAL